MAYEKILIAEKEISVAEYVKDVLISQGYTVTGIALSGEKMINRIISDEPDLIIIDYRIKGEIDSVVSAKEVLISKDLPVIYLIPESKKGHLIRVRDIQPYGCLTKPVDSIKLLAIVKRAFIYHAWGKIYSDDIDLCYAMYMDVICSGEGKSELAWFTKRNSNLPGSLLGSIAY